MGQICGAADFRSGSISTELGCPGHVRFTRGSDRMADIADSPVRANNGSDGAWISELEPGGILRFNHSTNEAWRLMRRPILGRTVWIAAVAVSVTAMPHAPTVDVGYGGNLRWRFARRRCGAARFYCRSPDGRRRFRRTRRAAQIHLGRCPYTRRNQRNYVSGAAQ